MFLPDREYSCLLDENSGISIPHKGWKSDYIHDGSGNIHTLAIEYTKEGDMGPGESA